MNQIPEEFVPLHVRYRRDRAIRRVGNDGELLYLRALAHAKAEKTGGLIEDFDLPDIASGIADKEDVARRLVEERLWVKVDNGWVIRSFEKWNPERSSDGKRGNHVKWHVNRGEFNPDCELCIHDSSPRVAPDIAPDSAGSSDSSQTREDKTREEKMREEGEAASETDAASELRPDVESLLDHLDYCVVSNGARKPSRGKNNLDAARLLLDKDGRDLDEAHRLIDWATSNDFWKSNILSMSKFREKYDQLLLQARSRAAAQQPRMPAGENESWMTVFNND